MTHCRCQYFPCYTEMKPVESGDCKQDIDGDLRFISISSPIDPYHAQCFRNAAYRTTTKKNVAHTRFVPMQGIEPEGNNQ